MALVSETNNFIFIHIYKCGGNSVRRMLGTPNIGQPDVNELSAYEVHGVHANIADVKRHFDQKGMEQFYNDAFKFTTIRNPFSMLVSLYKYIRNSKIHPYHDAMMNKNFSMFLHWYVYEAMFIERPYGANKYQFLHQFLEIAGTGQMDYIMRLEAITEDIKYACMRIGIPPKEMPIINVSKSKKPYRDFYSTENKQFVEEHFAKDLEQFNYQF